MGDLVERSLEDLVVSFEQLVRVQLFSNDEIQLIVKRCRQLEYRIQKTIKQKDDFLRYANYLKTVMRLIHKRRKKIQYFYKKDDIEDKINSKIDNLYERVCNRFPEDITLFRTRIEFNVSRNRPDSASRIYAKLVHLHSGDVTVWLEAADFEREKRGFFDSARSILHSALRLHANDARLYAQLLNVELDYVHIVNKRRKILLDRIKQGKTIELAQIDSQSAFIDEMAKETQDAVLEFKLVDIVIDEAIQSPAIKANVIFEMYRTASAHGEYALPIAEKLRSMLFTDKQMDEEPEAWLFRILLTLDENTLIVQDKNCCKKIKLDEDIFTVDPIQSVTNKCIEKAMNLVESGAQLCKDRKKFFLLILSYLNKKVTEDSKSHVALIEFYAKILTQMANENLLSQDEFVSFCKQPELATSTNFESLLTQLMNRFPKNVDIYTMIIQHNINNENIAEAKSLLTKAMNIVEVTKSLPLWLIALKLADDKKKLLQASFNLPSAISSTTKSLYLKAMSEAPIDELHAEFLLLAKKGASEKFFLQYTELLKSRSDAKAFHFEEAFRLCIKFHQATCVTTYLNYADYELQNDNALKCAEIYSFAKSHLKKSSDFDQFSNEYSRRIVRNKS